VVVFGVPLAYVLARYSFPGKVVLTAIVYMPLVLPPIVGGILLLLVWGQYGSVGQFLEPHGVLFVGQISGIILAQVFVSSPFVIVAARSAFERIDRDLEEAARTMGADTLRYFLSIALPIALRAILAGAALSWMRSFGEFGATVILAYHPYSFPVYTWVQFQQYGIGPVLPMALLSLILGAAALVAVAILERVGVFAAIIGRVSNSPRNPMHSYPAVGPD
jgi:molybdate/tungstate transport system permease protein